MAIPTLRAGNNKRYVERKELALGVPGRKGDCSLLFTIRNMSQTGFLAASDVDLLHGEMIEIDLPQVGTTTARVVWAGDEIFGFNFIEPITRGAVSAALLQGDPRDAGAPFVAGEIPAAGWDVTAEAGAHEKLPLPTRMRLILGLATIPWLVVAFALAVF